MIASPVDLVAVDELKTLQSAQMQSHNGICGERETSRCVKEIGDAFIVMQPSACPVQMAKFCFVNLKEKGEGAASEGDSLGLSPQQRMQPGEPGRMRRDSCSSYYCISFRQKRDTASRADSGSTWSDRLLCGCRQ